MGLDTKTYCLTDRQSQCDFDFDFAWSSQAVEELGVKQSVEENSEGRWIFEVLTDVDVISCVIVMVILTVQELSVVTTREYPKK
jgi:hypothetical protein